MRIGDYTLPQNPAPGWNPPLTARRIVQAATIGGARVITMPGHISDEALDLEWQWLEASPAKRLLQSYYSTAGDTDSIEAGERMAVSIPPLMVPPTEFQAVSAARLRLKANPALVGYLTVELWNISPFERIGLIGTINPADLSTSYQTIDVWSITAWPVASAGSWLVINGDAMTGGEVFWGGETTILNGHIHYDGEDWVAAAGEPWHEVYEGGQYCILRGLAGDESTVPPSYELDLADGGIYTARIAQVQAEMRLMPQAYDDGGLARSVRMSLVLESMR